jgi:ATP-dependent RNA helicase SUPV3L1/SUV3
VWRNSDLDFRDVEALVASLRVRPHHGALRLVAQADDYDALLQLSRRDDVRALARSPELVEQLWEVCRVPDFRKLALGHHVQLLATIFAQVAGPHGAIDRQWLAAKMASLGDTDGDIATLMQRIAFIRTMTYITHREHWVRDAEHWQAVARELEDRCSDALHQRLTERFVTQQAAVPRWPRRPAKQRAARPDVSLEPATRTGPFAQLSALLAATDDAPQGADDVDAWVASVVDAEHDALVLDEGRVTHHGHVVGVLARGVDLLHPEVRLHDVDGLGAGARSRLQRRLLAWIRDAIAELLAPLRAIDRSLLHADGRGLAYALEQGLGTVDGHDDALRLGELRTDEIAVFAAAGVYVRPELAYAAACLRPAMLQLRGALSSVQHGEPVPRALGAVAIEDHHGAHWSVLGYLARGPWAIRADVLARVHGDVEAAGDAMLRNGTELAARLGIPVHDVPAVLRAMGIAASRGSSRGQNE